MARYYPDSKVEIQGFTARHYDRLLNIITLGQYERFIRSAIKQLHLRPNEHILDFGCGTGKNACLMRQQLSDEGKIVGLDIAPEMEQQFKKNCAAFTNVEFVKQRIDQPFDLKQSFDRVFISFVLHGFPQQVRLQIVQNAHKHLKKGGRFSILDFAEFDMKKMPIYYRIPFKYGECPYAFDFIERDWQKILQEQGFTFWESHFWFHGYVRLLTVVKE